MKKHAKTGRLAEQPANGPAVAVMEVPAVQSSVTLCNLQAAYEAESNAQIRYLTFAKEADEEGYAPVASLFRAAARAEEIHSKNLEEVIRGLGVEPKSNLQFVVLQSTHDNLAAAIKGEIQERDEMYPAFLHEARLERNQPAARVFQLAQKVETGHASLFTQALQELERSRGDAVTYYVCPACGFTSPDAVGTRCPVCSSPRDRFDKVS